MNLKYQPTTSKITYDDIEILNTYIQKGTNLFKFQYDEANLVKDKFLHIFKQLGYEFLKKGIFMDSFFYKNEKYIRIKFTFPPNKYKIITELELKTIYEEIEKDFNIDLIEYIESKFNFFLIWVKIKNEKNN
jgi:hypothetical protein